MAQKPCRAQILVTQTLEVQILGAQILGTQLSGVEGRRICEGGDEVGKGSRPCAPWIRFLETYLITR